MGNSKKSIWIDIAFMLFGVITLLLLFMPVEFYGYRIAGYVGVLVFLIFMFIRERKRKREKKEQEQYEQSQPKNDEDEGGMA